MSNVIKLLPDAVANQIAAGEVIQRPASVVKELLENAIDAGSTAIKINIKDAGKTLIQIIDDGIGLSDVDAQLCFERHATSKIEKADDLFDLSTKGFRGEALASIAAIAHINLKSRQADNEIGTEIIMEGSKIKSQEPCQCSKGTTIAVKNLFYNVPARRKFLKSDAVETKHILEEFQRIAIAHPNVTFILHHNDVEVYHLIAGSLINRLIGINGKKASEMFVPVHEETSVLSVNGYIAKPEFSKKRRGEQYFFLNDRFIKSNYLNHAVTLAFDQLIAKDHYPGFFIFLQVDPSTIDINIHPTKTEVKFEDEKLVYSIVKSAVRQAIGKHNIAPTIDFNVESSFDFPILDKDKKIEMPTIEVDTSYNPFDSSPKRSPNTTSNYSSEKAEPTGGSMNWESLMDSENNVKQSEFSLEEHAPKSENSYHSFFQLHNSFIVTYIDDQLLVIDQQRAHQRILFDRYLEQLKMRNTGSQQLLFPIQLEFSKSEYVIISELKDDLKALGFDLEDFGTGSFIFRGLPMELDSTDLKKLMDSFIESYTLNSDQLNIDKYENIAKSMAFHTSIRKGSNLHREEIQAILSQLFDCDSPYYGVNGKSIMVSLNSGEIENMLN
jgi:DNA mismatch repair protein MutL